MVQDYWTSVCGFLSNATGKFCEIKLSDLRLRTLQELPSGSHLKCFIQASSSCCEVMVQGHVPRSWSEVKVHGHVPKSSTTVMVWSHVVTWHPEALFWRHVASCDKWLVMTVTVAFWTSTEKLVLLCLAAEHCGMCHTSRWNTRKLLGLWCGEFWPVL